MCRIFTRGIGLAAALLAASAGGTAALAAQARLRLATLAPKGTIYEQALLEMGEQWRNAPGGGARLIIYTDGRMGGEAEVVRRMRAGQVDAALFTAMGLGEIEPAVSALQNMPMMFRTLEEVQYVREQLKGELEKKFLEKGFIVLGWGDSGWVRFFSKKPAVMPDDLRKLKLFCWAGDPAALELWKAAGFRPVPLEVTDILPGLKTGLIDAVCSAPAYALAGQFDTEAPHMLDVHWAPLVGGLVVTAKAWQSVPEASRPAMLQAAAAAAAKVQKRGREEAEESIEAMKKRGLTVHPATPEVQAAWQKLAEDAWPSIRGKVVPADMFDRVVELLKEFRQKGSGGK